MKMKRFTMMLAMALAIMPLWADTGPDPVVDYASSYTVTFDANGGVIGNVLYASIVVEQGKCTMQAGASGTKVMRDGYTLYGWYDSISSSGGNMVFDAHGYAANGKYWYGSYLPGVSYATWKYDGNVIAYARWAQNKSTVTLDANGGSVSGQPSVSVQVEYGKNTMQAAANRTVVRSDYTLLGWYDTSFSSGGNMVFNANGYAMKGVYWDGSYSPGSSSAKWKYIEGMTAYARWAPNRNTITLDANGGTVSGQASVSVQVEYGKNTMQAAANRTVSRTDYTLVGWYDRSSSSGGSMVFDACGYAVNGKYWDGSYSPGESSAKWKYAGGMTAYARWAPNKSTVTLNANGGTVSGQSSVAVQVEYGKNTMQAGANRTVVRSGCTLVGWYDINASSGGNMVFDARGYAVNGKYWDGAYSPGASSAKWQHAKNVTVYARWVSSDRFRVVTFDANGGTIGDASYTCVVVEDGKGSMQAGASMTKTTRPGYMLVGWYDTNSVRGGNQIFDRWGYAVNGIYWDGSYLSSTTKAIWKYAGNVTAYARWKPDKSSNVSSRGGMNAEEGSSAAMLDGEVFVPCECMGAFVDGDGMFMLTLDERQGVAYFLTWTEEGSVERECEVLEIDGTIVLMAEAGEVYHLAWDGGRLVATLVE